jgi:hypothetical protein
MDGRDAGRTDSQLISAYNEHMVTRPLSPRRIWLARGVAIAADAIQIAILPASVWGAASPVDDVFDVVVAGILTLLVGWHIAFVPSFIVKLLPVADLAPTWTMAIFIATWKGKPQGEIPAAPPRLENM